MNRIRNLLHKPTVFGGIYRNGNQCFILAVLQLLYHCNEIKRAIYDDANNNSNIAAALKRIMERMSDVSKTTMLSDNEEEFFRTLLGDNDAVTQEDAGELLQQLLMMFKSLPTLIQTVRGQYINVTRPSDQNKVIKRRCIESIIYVNFHTNLTVDLETLLDNEYPKVEKAPKVLLVVLKRNESLLRKSINMIRVPEKLKFGGSKFEIVSDIVHRGMTPRCGHYFARVKSGDKWIKLDDEEVTETERNECNNDSYICCYRHIN
jgi:ubiquitin C-terminal hydrolase